MRGDILLFMWIVANKSVNSVDGETALALVDGLDSRLTVDIILLL